MNYTGERMLPQASDADTFWEHLHRYAFAIPHAAGRRVLDVACGTGYGSAALQRAGALSVVGVDVSAEACAFARTEFGIDTCVADAESLPFADRSFDLVVSFETIEHLAHPLRFLDECRRVLAPGGTLVISTPHRERYRQVTPDNPFHLHEFSRGDFAAECRRRFGAVQLFAQRPYRAAWCDPRGVATIEWPWLQFRAFRRARNGLVRALHPSLDRSSLERARRDPVGAILALPRRRFAFGHPYVVRAGSDAMLDNSVYLIAVGVVPPA